LKTISRKTYYFEILSENFSSVNVFVENTSANAPLTKRQNAGSVEKVRGMKPWQRP
jgi:hypothetical protein